MEELKELTYEEKKKLYQSLFSVGYLATENLNDRLILISLISLAYQKLKIKNSSITPLDYLLKITGQNKDNSAYYNFLESLSILVEDFSYNMKYIDSCGLKNSKEITQKIKDILDLWLPF